MKKNLYITIIALCTLFTSCEKDEIGGTATEAMAGQWYVQVDAVDAQGQVVFPDVYNLGNFLVLTYNASSNTADTLFVDDLKNFWNFQVKASCNISAKTFGNSDYVSNYKYDCGIKLTDGKILNGAATTPSGAVADSIVFYVEFDDDFTEYPSKSGNYIYTPDLMGFEKYRISGYRYTGLAADD